MRLSRLQPVSRRGKTVLALLIHLTVCAVALGFQFVAPSHLPSPYVMSVALTGLLAWCIGSWRLSGRELFDPYCIFLISAFLFNAGHGLLEVVGANERGILNDDFADDVVRQTLLLSFAGLAALHLGAMFVLTVVSDHRPPVQWPSVERMIWMRRIGWVLLAIAIPPATILLIESIAIASVSGYASLYDRNFQSGLAATPLVLSGFLVPGALFLSASGPKHAFDRRFGAAIIIIFAILQFYIGYRSTAAMPLIAWMWLRHKLIRPIRWSVLLSWSAVLVFVVFPLVRETRNLSQDERTGSFWSSFASLENPAISSIHEIGSSMATTAHTVTLVPTSRPYDEGVGYAYAFLTLFPNLFWDLHPTIARGTANDWLVRSINPWLAARGGAYGFSCIAEAYLNFGSLGVMPVMAIYGLLMVLLLRWAERTGDPAKLTLVAIVLAFILRFPRDELQGILRAVVWQGILPYLSVVATSVVIPGAINRRSIRLGRIQVREPETT